MTAAPARRSFLRYALVTVPLILGLGLLSGRLSGSGYGNPWFDALVKPAIMPPGWAFGLAWTTLYILLGLALALVLDAPRSPKRRTALGLFGAQLLLNFSWSPVFFAIHAIAPALAIILLMLALSIGATYLFARVRQPAAWLMMPHLAWLAFACLLTYRILELNPSA